MEPDKFEKHIKNKLEERRISPSDGAWERISGQINTPSKSKSGYFWLGIAASLLVLIGVSLYYFSSSKEIEKVPDFKVVDTKEPIIKEQETTDKNSVITVEEVIDVVVMDKKPESKVTKENAIRPKVDSVKEAMVDTNTLVNITPLDDNTEPVLSNEILNAKIAEVMAQVNAIEVNGKVTDAEVDSLLLNAQNDILREKLFNQDRTVNAMALLTEVEEELDQSFRNQIFETLKTGFLKVRTAVADRNN